MLQGQKVVCINDTFADFIRVIYTQLPVKGTTFTIREVFLGREKFCMAAKRPQSDYYSKNCTIHPILFMPVSKSLVFPRKGSSPLKS